MEELELASVVEGKLPGLEGRSKLALCPSTVVKALKSVVVVVMVVVVARLGVSEVGDSTEVRSSVVAVALAAEVT
jgi:hypothetical protein